MKRQIHIVSRTAFKHIKFMWKGKLAICTVHVPGGIKLGGPQLENPSAHRGQKIQKNKGYITLQT